MIGMAENVKVENLAVLCVLCVLVGFSVYCFGLSISVRGTASGEG